MKRVFVSVIMLAMAVYGAFADEENEIRYLKSFDKIEVSRGVEVVLTKADENNALIISDYYAMDDIVTEVTGSTLKISMAKMTTGDVNVEVRLSYIDLNEMEVKGNAIVRATGPLAFKKIAIKANTGGLVQLELNADEVELSAGENSVLQVKGKCSTLDAKSATTSTIYADKLLANKVIAKAGLGSKLFVSASEKVDAKANSGGVVTVSGNPPKISSATSLGGKVEMKDEEDADKASKSGEVHPQS